MDSIWLYLTLNIFVISIPLALSFDKKVMFYTRWRWVLPSIALIAAVFLAWDVLFTKMGVWGFDERYISGIELLNLPLSEWLFFLTVPYACLFIFASIRAYFEETLMKFPWRYVMGALLAGAIILLITNGAKPYTLSIGVLTILITVMLLIKKPRYAGALGATYMLSLIPFVLMNGMLTGSWIEGQVVWYNPQAFSGIRITTIPLEDFFYSFDLISLIIILAEWMESRKEAVHLQPALNKV